MPENIVYRLMATLGLDRSDFDNGLNGAREDAEKGGSKIGNALKTAGKLGATALAATTTATVAFAKSAVDASVSYESAFTGVTKTVEETATTSYEMISDSIKQMATETASSKEVIAGVMEAAGQLGISADDIVGFTETMIQLGDTTNLSAEEAAIALARFTNITGTSSSDVDKLGASIVDLGNNFATDEASIVAMSTRLASAGTIAGLSATDILGLSAAMSSVGIEAEAGGTAMTQVLTKIGNAVASGVDPSNKKLTEFAQIAGMSAEEFATAWKTSPVEALSQFVIGLDNANTAGVNVNAVLDDLGIKGIREANMIKSLALASDVLTDAVNTSNTAFQENTALINEAEKRYNTTESKVSQIKEAFSNLQVVVGDELTPTFREFLEFGTEGLQSLTQAFSEGGISGAMDALGGILSNGIAMLVDMLPKIVEAGGNLVMSLLEGIIQNLPKLAEAAIQIIQTLANGIVERLPDLMEKLSGVIVQLVSTLTNPETLTGLHQAALDFVLALADGIMKAIPTLLEALPEIVHNIIAFFISSIPRIIEAGYKLLSSLIEDMPNIIAAIVNVLPNLITGIVTGLMDGIPLLIDGGIKLLSSIVEDLPSIIANIIEAIPKIVNGIVKGFADNAGKLIESGLNLIASLIKGMVKAIPELIKIAPKLLEGIVTGIVGSLGLIVDAGKEIVSSIKEAIMNAVESAKQWGRDLIGNFVDGIKQNISTVTGVFKNVGQKIKDFLGFSEPKEGPLSNFHTYAPDMMKLFAQGIKDNEHLITDQIRSSFDFGGVTMGLGSSNTSNTYNITVNGIEELEEMLRWYESRQVRARMA